MLKLDKTSAFHLFLFCLTLLAFGGYWKVGEKKEGIVSNEDEKAHMNELNITLQSTTLAPTVSTYKPRSSADRRDDLIACTIWIIMLSYALCSNLLILIGILRNPTMRTATSYWFIISIAFCDILMTFVSFGHLVPATAFHEEFVEFKSTRNIVMIFFYDLFWYTGVVQLGLMAGNRFVSIVHPMEYKHFFSRRRTFYLILFGWFLGLVVSLPTLFDCCHTLWDSNFYITVYEKPDTLYKYVDVAVNSISLCMMMMSYGVIIWKVRKSGKAMAKYQLTIRTRHQNALMNGAPLSPATVDYRTSSIRPPRLQASKKEMRLFIQFFVVSIVFLLTWTTWQWLPYMSSSKWAYFAMTSLFFINNSVNPTVYLLFNTQLRRELHFFLCRHHALRSAQNKRKNTFGKGITTSNNKNMTKDDVTKSLVDQGGSLSSQSHTTTDEHVRPQLLIKVRSLNEATSSHGITTNIIIYDNMAFTDNNTNISAV